MSRVYVTELGKITLNLVHKDGNLRLDLEHLPVDELIAALEQEESTAENAQTIGSTLREFVRQYELLDKTLFKWIKAT